MALQDYFLILSLANRKVGQKWEIPAKNHLTTRKQNLHVIRARLNPRWWDDKWFRTLKISILNHSATLATCLPFEPKVQ